MARNISNKKKVTKKKLIKKIKVCFIYVYVCYLCSCYENNSNSTSDGFSNYNNVIKDR